MKHVLPWLALMFLLATVLFFAWEVGIDFTPSHTAAPPAQQPI